MPSILGIAVAGMLVICAASGSLEARGENEMKLRKLSAEESRVIIDKGTERPFSGKYVNHKKEGIYCCRQCGAGLYRSESKFESHCGWPAFDDYITGAVKMLPDVDGRRTEIVCARCNGHLGHVFYGEKFTDKGVRHCVNSVSMKFLGADEVRTGVFAGGCFWGVEFRFQGVPGVVMTRAGYTGGKTDKPEYKQVCGGDTGHIEAVEVKFDPEIVSYAKLVEFFFGIHDPELLNRQGADIGYQYRSAIFSQDESQRLVADKIIKRLRAEGVDVLTELRAATVFWPAEERHQGYMRKKEGKRINHE